LIPIMIVGEVDLVRGALVAVLAHEDDLEVTSAFPLPEDAITAAHAHRPAVVVIDVDRYGADGLAAIQRLGHELPECRVLVLTAQWTAEVIRRALAAGVWGVTSADTSPEQLVQSIRHVAAGERVIDSALAAAALQAPGSPLTEQERAALKLAGRGLRTKEIADQLFLSPGTVRNYLSAAMRKTGARNRLEALRRARSAGWL
jgi:two-component system, NarL family, response regulator DesR